MTKRFARIPVAAAKSGLLGSVARVLIAIAVHSDRSGACWPSLARIAAVSGLPRKKLPPIIAKLVAGGILSRVRGKPGAVTRYVLNFDDEVSPSERTGDVPVEGDSETRRVPSQGDRVSPHRGTDIAQSVPSQGDQTDQEIEQPRYQPTLLPLVSESKDPEIAPAFEAWNGLAAETGLPAVRKLTPALELSLQARLRECAGLEGWQYVLAKIAPSDFLCGRSASGWRCSLQWLVKPANFEKVIAGNYDRAAGAKQSPGAAMRAALNAEIARADELASYIPSRKEKP